MPGTPELDLKYYSSQEKLDKTINPSLLLLSMPEEDQYFPELPSEPTSNHQDNSKSKPELYSLSEEQLEFASQKNRTNSKYVRYDCNKTDEVYSLSEEQLEFASQKNRTNSKYVLYDCKKRDEVFLIEEYSSGLNKDEVYYTFKGKMKAVAETDPEYSDMVTNTYLLKGHTNNEGKTSKARDKKTKNSKNKLVDV